MPVYCQITRSAKSNNSHLRHYVCAICIESASKRYLSNLY